MTKPSVCCLQVFSQYHYRDSCSGEEVGACHERCRRQLHSYCLIKPSWSGAVLLSMQITPVKHVWHCLTPLPTYGKSWLTRVVCHTSACALQVLLPMEPLVGLLRHPTAGKYCRRADRPEFIDLAHDTPRDQVHCQV